MDSLSGFMVFMQVAETRSFVAAGRMMGVSASAVGKSVARLEEKLGTRLFHRNTRSITLTAEGTLFLERCRRILAEIEAAELEIGEATAKPRGRLRISLPPLPSLMQPVLSAFMHSFPDIELEMDFTDRLVDVVEEGFDAVVRTGNLANSRLTARGLGMYQMWLVASPDYLARRGTPKIPEDLLQHSCLHYRYPHTGKLEAWPIREPHEKLELDVPTSMVCNDIGPRLLFTLQGLGIAFLPDFLVKEFLAEDRLRKVLVNHVSRTDTLHVLWPASRQQSPKVRALIDFLRAQLPRVLKGKPLLLQRQTPNQET